MKFHKVISRAKVGDVCLSSFIRKLEIVHNISIQAVAESGTKKMSSAIVEPFMSAKNGHDTRVSAADRQAGLLVGQQDAPSIQTEKNC